MKWPSADAEEFKKDGRDPCRRDDFRKVPPPCPPTFEAYLASLDDLLATTLHAHPRPFVIYHNVKL